MAKLGYQKADKQWVQQKVLAADSAPDCWPYTPQFDDLYQQFHQEHLDKWSRTDFWRLILAVRKDGVSRQKRAKGVASPRLPVKHIARLRASLPRKRGAVDRLPYTDEFERIHTEFNRLMAQPASKSEVWLAIMRIVKSRLRKKARPYLDRAINSIFRAVNDFNEMGAKGRAEAVIIGVHYALEMLLKAALLQRGSSIRDTDGAVSWNILFAKCISMAISNADCKFLTDEQARFLRSLDGVRGHAYHALIELDETELYLHTHTAIKLFDEILQDVFDQTVAEHLDARVLPVCTIPMANITVLLDRKQSQIAALLEAGHQARAVAAAASLVTLECAAAGNEVAAATHKEAKGIVDSLAAGARLAHCLPRVAAIELVAAGSGATIHLSVHGKVNYPVHVFPDDGATPFVAYRHINPATDFPLSTHDLAQKCGCSFNVAVGVINELDLKRDPESCFMHGRTGAKTQTPGYSAKALDRIRKFLASYRGDPLDIWRKHCRKSAKTA